MKLKAGTVVLVLLFMIVLSTVMHWRIFKLDLIGYHVWRQTETQTVIDNFASNKSTIFQPKINDLDINNGIHVREFPIMQWCFAQVEKHSTSHVWWSRILSYCIHLITACGFLALCNAVFKNVYLGLVAAWFFLFSPVMYYYAVNPLPDNLALSLAVWGTYFAFRWWNNNSMLHLSIAFLNIAIATLVKLPFIVMGVILFYLVLIRLFKLSIRQSILVLIASSTLCLPVFWYLYSVPYWHGVGVKQGVFSGDLSIGNSIDILQHNFISTIPELFINYAGLLFFLVGVFFYFYLKPRGAFVSALIWQTVFVIIYFLVEHNMIGKVHDYYLFPFMLSILMVMVYGAKQLASKRVGFLRYFGIISFVLMPLTCYLRSQTRWNEENPGFNVTLYKNHQEIRSLMPTNAKCIVGEDDSRFIWLYYVQRKGWSFGKNGLSHENFDKWIKAGATHMIADKPVWDSSFVKHKLNKLIYHKGDVYMYTIKQSQ